MGILKAREPCGPLRGGSAERETLKPRSWRVRMRSNSADLPAMQIDAPVGKNLGTRRLAPHGSRQERPKASFVLMLGKPGYNGSSWRLAVRRKYETCNLDHPSKLLLKLGEDWRQPILRGMS